MARLLGTTLLIVTLLLLPTSSGHAAPIVANDFLFTDNRGPNPFVVTGHRFVLGATSITPSGSPTSASATHVPLGSAPDFTLSFVPSPQFPNQYAVTPPYSGQTGQWDITAADLSGSTTRRTHILSDVRVLPLITGLSASGPFLAPHLTWDPVDAMTFPSFCSEPPGGIFPLCEVGVDFFNYQVEVRIVTGEPGNPAPLVFSSAGIPTSEPGGFDPVSTEFDLPAGVLQPGNQYLLGIRLTHNELEAILAPFPNPRFFSPLENRSTAFLEHSTVPEPSSLVLLAIGTVGLAARRRRRR